MSLTPPESPLTDGTIALRPFRSDDAVAVAAACADPDIVRFTLMPEGLTAERALRWIEWALAGWSDGIGRFAITTPPSDVCVGQVGLQLDERHDAPRPSTGWRPTSGAAASPAEPSSW